MEMVSAADATTLIPKKSNPLGKKIVTGNIQLSDIPQYIAYLIQFLIAIAGTVALIGVMMGGYFYVIGSISEDKDKGKTKIKNSLIGFSVAILSYIIVDLVIRILTPLK